MFKLNKKVYTDCSNGCILAMQTFLSTMPQDIKLLTFWLDLIIINIIHNLKTLQLKMLSYKEIFEWIYILITNKDKIYLYAFEILRYNKQHTKINSK